MAYTVSKSHCFEEDYDSILAYLLNELKAPRAALTLMGEVEKALDLLERDPFIHAVSRLPALGAGGCQEHLVKNYRIVYKVREARFTFFVCSTRLSHAKVLSPIGSTAAFAIEEARRRR